MSTNTIVVSIAGGSCSGKTTLARGLAERHGDAVVVPIDAYYHDLSGVPEHTINVDVPEAIESELLFSHVRMLLAGHPVTIPNYEYATHSRQPGGTKADPCGLVIVEGLFALHWDVLRELSALDVFVDIDHEEALKRRLARDVAERGQQPERINRVYREKVAPMYDQHVAPTAVHADLCVDGLKPPEELVRAVIDNLPNP